LLDHPSKPLDAYDLPLEDQLAIVKASALFLSPHTGFGLAALATGTPWLTLSGARTPSMSDERFVAAAGELIRGELSYERALREYFAALESATNDIWSIDGVHLMYVK
jgi:hypothetical protein